MLQDPTVQPDLFDPSQNPLHDHPCLHTLGRLYHYLPYPTDVRSFVPPFRYCPCFLFFFFCMSSCDVMGGGTSHGARWLNGKDGYESACILEAVCLPHCLTPCHDRLFPKGGGRKMGDGLHARITKERGRG